MPITSAKQLWRFPLFRTIVWLGLLYFAARIFLWYQEVFLPVGIGLLLAYLCHPVIVHSERKWGMRKAVSSTIIIALVTLTIAGFGAWLGPIAASQLQTLRDKFPSYINTVSQLIGRDLRELVGSVGDYLSLAESNGGLLAGTGKLWEFAMGVFSKATYVMYLLIAVPVAWYVFMTQIENILNFIKRFIPASKREITLRMANKIDHVFAEFFRGRLLIMMMVGAMCSFGWWLVDVPYWFVLGMITGFFTLVPFLSAIGWPFAIILKYVELSQQSGSDFTFWAIIFWPSAVYLIAQFIEGWILTPVVQGDSLDLHPGTVMLTVFLGGAAGGILGMILAIPLTASVKIILLEIVFPKLEAWSARH